MQKFLVDGTAHVRSKRAGLLILAGLVGSSCAGPSGWPEPVEEGTAAPPEIAVETAALTPPVKAAHIVAADGSHGYCDDVLFSSNHGAAIQDCIDKAFADGGGVVLLRAGSYSTGTWPLNVKQGVRIEGDGNIAATLAPTATQIIASVGPRAAIENLRFNMVNVTEGAIRLGTAGSSPNEIRIENNFFDAGSGSTATQYGVYLTSGANSFRDIVVRGNTFSSNGSAAPLDAVHLAITSGSGAITNVRVDDNALDLETGGTIRLDGNTVSCPGNSVSGNTIRTYVASGLAIVLDLPYQAKVKDNTIAGYVTSPIVVMGSSSSCGASVTGNALDGEPFISPACTARSLVTGNSDNRTDSDINTPGGALIGKAGVIVRAYRTGNQTFTAGTGAAIVFNGETIDYGENFNAGTGTFTAPVTGLYQVHACARISSGGFGASDTATISLQVVGAANATAIHRSTTGGSTDTFSNCVNDVVRLNKDAGLQARIDASGSGSRTVNGTGSYSTYIHIQQVSD